jgi:ferrochelatase
MHGIWLIQLGTPENPTASEANRFISEFLMDRRVIDLPTPLRWLLVKTIVPSRAKKIADAYAAIWQPQGSPLRVYSLELQQKLQAEFGTKAIVKLGMTYGKPSLNEAWQSFKAAGVNKLTIVPLFPQYASATTGACLERVCCLIRREQNIPAFQIVPAFYNEDFFIDSIVDQANKYNLGSYDHILFSFHGLPEDQVRQSDPTQNHCLVDPKCCDKKVFQNAFCYRHQCFETAKILSEKLSLSVAQTTVSFQSRLGKTQWLKPYTEEIVAELAKKGVRRLAVFSPSFVADCLETLEEIGIRAKAQFKALGGDDLCLIPAVNASENWVKGLSKYLERFIG